MKLFLPYMHTLLINLIHKSTRITCKRALLSLIATIIFIFEVANASTLVLSELGNTAVFTGNNGVSRTFSVVSSPNLPQGTFWLKVLERSNNAIAFNPGVNIVNEIFQLYGNGMVRYDLDDAPYAYYKRLRNIPTFNFYANFAETWTDASNVLNVDFEIYSSEANMLASTGRWLFCNYNNRGTGFPRDCGPTAAVTNKWSFFYGSTYPVQKTSPQANVDIYIAVNLNSQASSNAVIMQSASTAFYTGANGIRTSLFMVSLSGGFAWVKVLERYNGVVTLNLGHSIVNTLYQLYSDSNGAARYDINGQPYVYYKRLRNKQSFSFYSNFAESWTSTSNVLNTDFELYQLYSSLTAGTNRWTYCNYNDPAVGFPRDCGATSAVTWNWNQYYDKSFPYSITPQVQNAAVWIRVAISASPTRTPSFAPTRRPTLTPSARPTLSLVPTETPSASPTLSLVPTETPSVIPSLTPSRTPSTRPSQSPTRQVRTLVRTSSTSATLYTNADSSSVFELKDFKDTTNTGWIRVFQRANNVITQDPRPDIANQIFQLFSTGVAEYLVNGVVHNYYKRITDKEHFEFYRNFASKWSDSNNVLNTNFEMYSTLADLSSGVNKWQYCNYNGFAVPYPRECGPTGPILNMWTQWDSGYVSSLSPAPNAELWVEVNFGLSDAGLSVVQTGSDQVTYTTSQGKQVTMTMKELDIENGVAWVKLLEKKNSVVTTNYGMSIFNTLYQLHSTGILQYVIDGQPYSYYKRHIPWRSHNLYERVVETWTTNRFNIDFSLYSTWEDVKADTNRWQAAGSLVPLGVGFPGYSGPVLSVSDRWCSFYDKSYQSGKTQIVANAEIWLRLNVVPNPAFQVNTLASNNLRGSTSF